MSIEQLAAYAVACFLLALTPGPNMALIIATTLSGGLGAGLATIAGTSTGLAIIVAAAAVGMSSLMVFMADWFDVVRWVGAVYLAVLGGLQLRQFWRKRRAGERQAEPRDPAGSASMVLPHGGGQARQPSASRPGDGAGRPKPARAIALFLQGLGVSLSNPKALLFLGAFLPQFVDLRHDAVPQLWALAVLFVAILATVDVAYTFAVARARATIAPRKLALLDGASGALLLTGGIALATLRRP